MTTSTLLNILLLLPFEHFSADDEKTQPTDWQGEDPDKIRREVFKRMFPEVPPKRSQ